MKEEEYKKHIEFAKNLTKDLSEPFKTESFKIILAKLLDSDISTKKSSSSKKRTPQKSQDKEVVGKLTIVENSEEIMSGLANELGIELDQLQDTISINDNKIEIISSLKGTSSKQKMIKGSLCVLLLFEKFYNIQWVKSDTIGEQLREIGIHDPGGNLSTHLKNESELIRYRGSGGSREYKLTTTEGRKKALEVLKEPDRRRMINSLYEENPERAILRQINEMKLKKNA